MHLQVEFRLWEAKWAARYWRRYFKDIGADGASRRSEGPIQAALDAGSFFLSGIILRWTLVHRLSPGHGFLHEGTDYPGLIYDLMEPYRYTIEESVRRAFLSDPLVDEEDITKKSLANLKHYLDESVYVPVTRQVVRRKNLLHGIVLALRAYLAGDMQRFVIPAEGERIGGRPVKVSYTLPGGRG